VCICTAPALPSASATRRPLVARAADAVLEAPPLRRANARHVLKASVAFDANAARRLPPAEHLIAFNGVALAQFGAATRARFQSRSLVSATAHLRSVLRQYDRAYRQYPLEGSWAPQIAKRTMREYGRADRIYVSSPYARESFLEEGVGEQLLETFPLTPDPRFEAREPKQSSPVFEVVYVGALTVVKGVPLLIDAVRALAHSDIRLTLVGGWASRGMRRFVERACGEDSRIRATHGDPEPQVRAARLLVHPTFSDGFGYAPLEALSCGVPVIVSEDTGMKHLIDRKCNRGLIVPTGDVDALAQAIDAAYRGEVLGAPERSGR
jgi:glycosyltransferase involved in cell wall biosynthesis